VYLIHLLNGFLFSDESLKIRLLVTGLFQQCIVGLRHVGSWPKKEGNNSYNATSQAQQRARKRATALSHYKKEEPKLDKLLGA
jgi:hypothetical protein